MFKSLGQPKQVFLNWGWQFWGISRKRKNYCKCAFAQYFIETRNINVNLYFINNIIIIIIIIINDGLWKVSNSSSYYFIVAIAIMVGEQT